MAARQQILSDLGKVRKRLADIVAETRQLQGLEQRIVQQLESLNTSEISSEYDKAPALPANEIKVLQQRYA